MLHLDIVPQHLAMSLGTSLAQSFSSFASSSHGGVVQLLVVKNWWMMLCQRNDILSTLVFVCYKSLSQNAIRNPPWFGLIPIGLQSFGLTHLDYWVICTGTNPDWTSVIWTRTIGLMSFGPNEGSPKLQTSSQISGNHKCAILMKLSELNKNEVYILFD